MFQQLNFFAYTDFFARFILFSFFRRRWAAEFASIQDGNMCFYGSAIVMVRCTLLFFVFIFIFYFLSPHARGCVCVCVLASEAVEEYIVSV